MCSPILTLDSRKDGLVMSLCMCCSAASAPILLHPATSSARGDARPGPEPHVCGGGLPHALCQVAARPCH